MRRVLLILAAFTLGACVGPLAPPTAAPTATVTATATLTPTPRPTATTAPTPTVPWATDGYALVWADEFDGPAIDPGKWSFVIDGRGGGNNELQYYTDRPENARLEAGALVIEARAERHMGHLYTSARLHTLAKGDWAYGRIVVRARLPKGQGLWPAIWMLPTDSVYGTWAASGEIDLMELIGHEPNVVHGTLHYGDRWPNNVHSGDSFRLAGGATFADDWHTFRVDWEPEEFRWYVDDTLYQTQTRWHTASAPYPAPFDQRFHLVLNVAVGGNWPGHPDETTVFPQTMQVDFVRVFQKP